MSASFRLSDGHVVDLIAPLPSDFDHLPAFAYHLSNVHRWGGATEFTVAQHCVIVSHLCPPEYAAWGLLHDLPEAVLGDVVHHLKALLGEAYRSIERLWQAATCEYFGVEPVDIKLWDDEAARLEAEYIWPSADPCSIVPGRRAKVFAAYRVQHLWTPNYARCAFMRRAKQLLLWI